MFDNSTLEPSVKLPTGFFNKLSRVFSVGPYYYYVFNANTVAIEYVSKGVTDLLGCREDEFTVAYAIDHIHPEDMAYFLKFEAAVVEFLKSMPVERAIKYKMQYDYRIRRKDQSYIRVLQQAITLEQGPNGEVIRSLCMHTNISHIKKDGIPLLSFIGMDGEPSYIDVSAGLTTPADDLLSKREKEILFYLICGNSSEEIASILFLSKETVSTHRKNMLKKTKSRNTNELIARAIKGGQF